MNGWVLAVFPLLLKVVDFGRSCEVVCWLYRFLFTEVGRWWMEGSLVQYLGRRGSYHM